MTKTKKPAKPAKRKLCISCLVASRGSMFVTEEQEREDRPTRFVARFRRLDGTVVSSAQVAAMPSAERVNLVFDGTMQRPERPELVTPVTDTPPPTWNKPTIHPESCTTCHRCDQCRCSCRVCGTCGTRTPTTSTSRWCKRCNCCRRCDRCRKMPHFSPPTAYIGTRSSKFINTLPRALGIELEIGEWGRLADYSMHYATYTTAHDWSVKPSEREMVLHPLAGDNFLRAMCELSIGLVKSHAKVNNTCALHVHVSGGDLSYWELRRILRVYSKIEAEIYDYLILPHRRDVPSVTHYCQMMTRQHVTCERCQRFDEQYPRQRRPLPNLFDVLAEMDTAKSNSELKAHFLKMLYNLPMPGQPNPAVKDPTRMATLLNTRKGGRYEWARYVGLNLHAWLYRGTIEWRMKEATTTIDDLICWPLWCGWFVEAAAQMTEKDSTRWWNLVEFTDKHMPRFVTEWVSNKISQRKAIQTQAQVS